MGKNELAFPVSSVLGVAPKTPQFLQSVLGSIEKTKKELYQLPATMLSIEQAIATGQTDRAKIIAGCYEFKQEEIAGRLTIQFSVLGPEGVAVGKIAGELAKSRATTDKGLAFATGMLGAFTEMQNGLKES